MKKYRIIFMGTPEFSLASLKAIVESNFYTVAAVYTQQDKQEGRGQKFALSHVKEYSISNVLKILQPATMKNE